MYTVSNQRREMMQRILVNILISAAVFLASAVQSETPSEKELFQSGAWRVLSLEWSDGEKQCVAESLQGEGGLDIVVAINSISFGLYIGKDASQSDKKLFSFRIDNYPPWKKNDPSFDDGWLIYELLDVSENTFDEIERQFRKGNMFYHLDERGYTINSFSLKGSNAALTALQKCIDAHLDSEQQATREEPKEMLMGNTPPDFEVGYRNDSAEVLMTEYVPIGQTVHDWSRMITIQGLIDYRPITLQNFATSFTQLVIDECSDSAQDILQSGEQLGYVYIVFGIACFKNLQTNMPEFIFAKAIQGDDALYLVQKAWRYEPSEDALEDWMGQLETFSVCGRKNEFAMCM